jgi:hypothetical protein
VAGLIALAQPAITSRKQHLSLTAPRTRATPRCPRGDGNREPELNSHAFVDAFVRGVAFWAHARWATPAEIDDQTELRRLLDGETRRRRPHKLMAEMARPMTSNASVLGAGTRWSWLANT